MAVTLYVNTVPHTSGDGSTNGTGDGGTNSYVSLAAAIAAVPATLTEPYTIICEGTAADTTQVIIGTVTSADNFLLIKTDPAATAGRHHGIWSETHYRLSVSDTSYGAIRINASDYVRIDGVQLETVSPTGHARHIFGLYGPFTDGVCDIRMSNCILRGHNHATWQQSAITPLQATPTLTCWNTIAYNVNTISGNQCFTTAGIAGVYKFYNCTFIGGNYGIRRDTTGTVTIINCYAGGCGTASITGTIGTLTDFAAYDAGGSEAGLDSIAVDSTTFVDHDASPPDYHLGASSPLIGVGTDNPGSGLYSDDIDGVARTSTWDIGADEYVSSGQSLAGLAALSTGTVVAQAIAAGAVALAGSAGLSTWTLLTQALVSAELLAQSAIRWRLDDEDEDTATWAAAENAGLSAVSGTKRVRVQVNHTGDPAAITPKWQYRRKPSGGAWGDWTTVGS